MVRASFFVLFCAACGGAVPAAPPPAPEPAPPPPAPSPTRCSELDVKELLARHARELGSPAAVAAELPMTLHADADLDGKHGRASFAMDGHAWRSQLDLAAVHAGDGRDAKGFWTLGAGSGVIESLRDDEADGVEDWLLRRTYVDAFDAQRDKVECKDKTVLHADEQGQIARPPTVSITFHVAGEPTLGFDLATAVLVSAEHTSIDGRKFASAFDWGDRDAHGVRWPRLVVTRSSAGNRLTQRYEPATQGADVARPSDRFVLAFPDKASIPNGTGLAAPGVVRVPLDYVGSSLLVRVKLGGREAWALLDSGAGITVVEASSRAAEGFQSSVEMNGAGATQRVKFGVGELPAIDVGDLHAEHVPAASVPIPALDSFGSRRPEVILGYSFFAAAGIRVDYKKAEIVFAKTAAGLTAMSARELPMHVLDGKLAADGDVEGHAATFELDTGSSSGLDFYAKWARANGIPGDRKTAVMTARFGAGEGATPSTFFRLGKASLGPIAFDGGLSHTSDPPDPGRIAGLAGNEIFARCDAVVFDHEHRKLWLEGACDRPVPEPRAGWRLERKDDAWVIGILWPGGAAERAGAHVGDRVLEVDGKPVTSDVAPLVAINTRAEGTKLPVVVERDGKKERVVLELHAPLR